MFGQRHMVEMDPASSASLHYTRSVQESPVPPDMYHSRGRGHGSLLPGMSTSSSGGNLSSNMAPSMAYRNAFSGPQQTPSLLEQNTPHRVNLQQEQQQPDQPTMHPLNQLNPLSPPHVKAMSSNVGAATMSSTMTAMHPHLGSLQQQQDRSALHPLMNQAMIQPSPPAQVTSMMHVTSPNVGAATTSATTAVMHPHPGSLQLRHPQAMPVQQATAFNFPSYVPSQQQHREHMMPFVNQEARSSPSPTLANMFATAFGRRDSAATLMNLATPVSTPSGMQSLALASDGSKHGFPAAMYQQPPAEAGAMPIGGLQLGEDTDGRKSPAAAELNEFAKQFKMKRMRLGYTQQDVGKELGSFYGKDFSQTTICRFEAQQLSPRNMGKIYAILKQWSEDVDSNGHHVPVNHNKIQVKKRKKRTSIDAHAKTQLEHFFSLQPKPSAQDIGDYAKNVSYPHEVVRVWFSNRRQKSMRTNGDAVNADAGNGDAGNADAGPPVPTVDSMYQHPLPYWQYGHK